jgi:MoaA/NifB/PqqE/SkfB family radical SAM enzyme
MSLDHYKELHLELTSKCTLKCPLCPRTEHFGEYNVKDLPLETIRQIVSTDKVYSSVSLCGDHGDPIYHSQFHDALPLLHQLPDQPLLSIATNGSHRKIPWWEKTAELLREKDHIVFGIDGLEDTNPIYRVNSSWSSILDGIKTVRKKSKAKIVWQWILFKHNEHQLVEAKKMATDLGVDRFMIVLSSRYEDESKFCQPTINLQQAKEILTHG